MNHNESGFGSKGEVMSSITLHNLDRDLEKVIRQSAAENHISLNKFIKMVLRDSLGLNKEQKKKRDVSGLAFSWSPEEAEAFEQAITGFEIVDQDMW